MNALVHKEGKSLLRLSWEIMHKVQRQVEIYLCRTMGFATQGPGSICKGTVGTSNPVVNSGLHASCHHVNLAEAVASLNINRLQSRHNCNPKVFSSKTKPGKMLMNRSLVSGKGLDV